MSLAAYRVPEAEQDQAVAFLKTLDIRMERHCANAQKVAAFFTSHPAVAKVYYPGLDTFPGHEIAAKQMKLPGGMISIDHLLSKRCR